MVTIRQYYGGGWRVIQRRSDEMLVRPNLYVVPFGGHRSAPRVIAALAGVVHNPAGHEHNHDEDNQ
jgi:hypothetical protein